MKQILVSNFIREAVPRDRRSERRKSDKAHVFPLFFLFLLYVNFRNVLRKERHLAIIRDKQ